MMNNFSTSVIYNCYENLSVSVSGTEQLCRVCSEVREFCCRTAGRAECACMVFHVSDRSERISLGFLVALWVWKQ